MNGLFREAFFNPDYAIAYELHELKRIKIINPDYALESRMTRMNTNKNNKVHWIRSGRNFVSVFIGDFVDIFGFIRMIRGFIPDTGQVFIKEKMGEQEPADTGSFRTRQIPDLQCYPLPHWSTIFLFKINVDIAFTGGI